MVMTHQYPVCIIDLGVDLEMVQLCNASTSAKIKGINIIPFIDNNIPEISTAISLRSGKILNELILKKYTKEK